MNYHILSEMQTAGAFKVAEGSSMVQAIIAGQALTGPMCDLYAQKIGWTGRRACPSYQLVDKTNTYIRAFKRYITKERFNGFDITFENIRLSDSLKTFDRIVMTGSDGTQFTIIHGMPGIGGSYALFSPAVSQAQPIFTSRSMNGVCEYLNSII